MSTTNIRQPRRVLLLTGAPARRHNSLNGPALRTWLQNELGDNYTVTLGALSELTYYVSDTARIYHADEDYDLADFDLVVFRTVGKWLELGTAAATYLRAKGVRFTDPYLLMPAKGKLACSFMRWAAGIGVPTTLYAKRSRLAEAVRAETLTYPLVVKADTAKKGRDNYLVADATALTEKLAQAAPEAMMLAQPMITNKGDYRILVLNGEAKLALYRTRAKDTHLNNVSAGAQAGLVSLSEVPRSLLTMAEHAANLEKLTIAGVDIIVDDATGRTSILEVNRAPQLATGAYAEDKMHTYADTLRALIEDDDGGEQPLSTIGRAEHVCMPDQGELMIPAKVDTGADSSSIWASEVEVVDGMLRFVLFAQGSPYYTGALFSVPKSDYRRARIENSFGEFEIRYVVKLRIIVGGRIVRASFTLADRSKKIYPILLGRRLLAGRFVVDVRQGSPLLSEERLRRRRLNVALVENED